MEYDRYSNRAGRELEAIDIARLERTVFMPATQRCQVMDDGAGGPLYYARDEAMRREDGLEYRHYFYAKANKKTSLPQYSVYQDAADTIGFDRLTLDERNIVIAQFRERHTPIEGDMSALGKNTSWAALYDPATHHQISLSIVSTVKYMFTGDQAVKSFTAERRMTFDNKIIKLDSCGYDAELSDCADAAWDWWMPEANQQSRDWWTPERTASLGMVGEDMCAVTTKDMDAVVGILDDMKLVSYDDRVRYVRGA